MKLVKSSIPIADYGKGKASPEEIGLKKEFERAARNNNMIEVKRLLPLIKETMRPGKYLMESIITAATRGNKKIVEVLLEAGGRAPEEGLFFVQKDHPEIARLIEAYNH